MFHIAVIALLLMLVTGARFTKLAAGFIGILLKFAAVVLAVWLLGSLMSGLSTKQGLWLILGVGGVLLVIEEVLRFKYNQAHPHAPIDLFGKTAGK